MSTAVPISLRLGNRQYKIKVPAAQEESVRQSLQQIQETANRLRKEFPGRDEQDYLAMTLIDFITTARIAPANAIPDQQNEELINQLSKLSTLLDS